MGGWGLKGVGGAGRMGVGIGCWVVGVGGLVGHGGWGSKAWGGAGFGGWSTGGGTEVRSFVRTDGRTDG